MKRNILLLLFSLFVCISSFSQEGLYQLAKNYFRSNPFIGEFSGFLKHLINDPALQDKKIQQRTDSTLFYFYAEYKNYNPYFFKPNRVEVLLEETSVRYVDSLPADTILIYQLLAYSEESRGPQEIKKEFERIHRKYNKKFAASNFLDMKTGKEITGGLHNYFVSFAGLAPVSIVWGLLKETNEYVLNITLRLKSNENRTILPATFYNP